MCVWHSRWSLSMRNAISTYVFEIKFSALSAREWYGFITFSIYTCAHRYIMFFIRHGIYYLGYWWSAQISNFLMCHFARSWTVYGIMKWKLVFLLLIWKKVSLIRRSCWTWVEHLNVDASQTLVMKEILSIRHVHPCMDDRYTCLEKIDFAYSHFPFN